MEGFPNLVFETLCKEKCLPVSMFPCISHNSRQSFEQAFILLCQVSANRI